jgi:CubicO group peptidase (beta-lactamase class C family)
MDMSASGLSAARLGRLGEVLGRHVARGDVPGLVAVVARRGEVHVTTLGTMAADGAGGPMERDTIFRIASLTKLIVATAAMTLIEDGTLRLDDPVDGLLPELADRRVLRDPDGPLDDTVPAERAVTVRDLLTLRFGLGLIMTPGTSPIRDAMSAADLWPGPDQPMLTPDEWMQRLGRLPLAYQPGQAFLYHTGADVLCVLVARAAGAALPDVLAERVFGPLGMTDSGFYVPADKRDRLAAAYQPKDGGLVLEDDPAHGDSAWFRPPLFPSELVSTADDLLAFGTMLLSQGRAPVGRRLLSRPAVELMTTDQLTAEQRAANTLFFGDGGGWGLGGHVTGRRADVAGTPGRFGWNGGTGTTMYTDRAEELTGILLTQAYMTSPQPPLVFRDFWTCAYAAIDD